MVCIISGRANPRASGSRQGRVVMRSGAVEVGATVSSSLHLSVLLSRVMRGMGGEDRSAHVCTVHMMVEGEEVITR